MLPAAKSKLELVFECDFEPNFELEAEFEPELEFDSEPKLESEPELEFEPELELELLCSLVLDLSSLPRFKDPIDGV